MAFLIALLAIGGWSFGGANGLWSFAAIGLVLNFGSYWFSEGLALLAHRARPASREEGPVLYAIVERLSAEAEMPTPYEFAGPATAHLFIIHPLRGTGARMLNLLSTHPPIEARIARLRAMRE